ncbi:MAG: DUF1993 domain-containing protein [Caulobacter sp.]|nr:DUF1993 domain-containing protein [Caulobacter sp.]
MTISLYDITVGQYLQTVDAAAGFLERGLKHCTDEGANPDDLVGKRLAGDMLPLSFQVSSIAHHSIGAIEAVQAGVFQATGGPAMPETYAGLIKIVADAQAALRALTPDAVNALAGKDVTFEFGPTKMPFTAEGFLLSFSLPNFYFHASTAYDVLRANGVPLGKRYFLGQLKLKG